MLRARLPWFVTLAFAANAAVAQEASYQGVSYLAPPGWSGTQRGGQIVLAPAGLSDQTAVAVVLLGAESLGGNSFQDWLRTRMASLLSPSARVLRASPVQSSASGNLQVLSTGRTVQDGSGGVRLQIYYAIADGKQAAVAMLLTASEDALRTYLPTIQRLFGSLRFSAAALAPAPSPIATSSPPATAPAEPGAARILQKMIYPVPAGWSTQANGGSVVLSPRSGLQGAETLNLVILPAKASGNLEQEFQATWLEVCAMLRAESMRNVSGQMFDLEGVARSANGWDFLRGTGGARNAQQRFTVSLFLAKVNERIERVAIISREIQVNLTVATAALNPRFQGAIDAFLFGLRFADWNTPTFADARLTGGAITGVWEGISMFGGRFKTGAVAFFSDGSAWFGSNFPTYGLDGIKPHVERDADRRQWGNYQFQSGNGVLTMPYGAIPLRLDGSVLVLTTNKTPHRFVRRYPPVSSRLSGRYCLAEGSGCLTLAGDGRFHDEGAGRIVEHAVYPYPLSPERGDGEYEIRDYTLILRYAGGPEVRVAFPGFLDRAAAASTSPDVITLSFNMDVLKRM